MTRDLLFRSRLRMTTTLAAVAFTSSAEHPPAVEDVNGAAARVHRPDPADKSATQRAPRSDSTPERRTPPLLTTDEGARNKADDPHHTRASESR